jgi:hypothetical protein
MISAKETSDGLPKENILNVNFLSLKKKWKLGSFLKLKY